ncbi:MAG: hypothetical protein ACLFUV_00070 [Methanomassiliicoccales archaeon]
MKKIYQCLVCGKAHDAEEKAMNCHDGPIQTIITGVSRWPKEWWAGH